MRWSLRRRRGPLYYSCHKSCHAARVVGLMTGGEVSGEIRHLWRSSGNGGSGGHTWQEDVHDADDRRHGEILKIRGCLAVIRNMITIKPGKVRSWPVPQAATVVLGLKRSSSLMTAQVPRWDEG